MTIEGLAFDRANIDFAAYEESNRYYRHCGNQGGVVVGCTYGSVTFEGVSVTNSTVYGYGKIGCLLGYAESDPITFKNCISKNNTIYAVYNIGGLAGHIQRSGGIDNTTVENCVVDNITVDYNDYVNGVNRGSGDYIDLDNVTATFKSNDDNDGVDVKKTISGKYWVNGNYYWGAYGKYYISYGLSSYDAPLAGRTLKLANSEICVNEICVNEVLAVSAK